MAVLAAEIQQRVKQALAVVSRCALVRAAYVFGSQVEGTATEWSDIDIAVFIENGNEWDLVKRVKTAVAVMKEAGDDIEIHFFPAESLVNPDPASFAAFIMQNGVRVDE
jgi:predicted nucleotidyltransferase